MNSSASVVVVADIATGTVINVSQNNPEFGYIIVQQFVNQYDEKGFLKRKKLTALIKGEITDLQAASYHAGQLLPGKIVTEESLEPFNTENPERDFKRAGKTGIICEVDGKPIYRRTYYTEKENVSDILLGHTNKQQIKDAFQIEKASAIRANEEFNI